MSIDDRKLEIELLRIFAMVMIIIGHAIGHTKLLQHIPKDHINYWLISMISVFCNMATNIYTHIRLFAM